MIMYADNLTILSYKLCPNALNQQRRHVQHIKSSYWDMLSKMMNGTNPLNSLDTVHQRSASWCFQPTKHLKHT